MTEGAFKIDCIVGVKYCGNCNPVIDSAVLVSELKQVFGDMQFTSWDNPEKDLLLILSGCPRDCATRPSFNGPLILVAGYKVNGWETNPWQLTEHLARCMAKAINGGS